MLKRAAVIGFLVAAGCGGSQDVPPIPADLKGKIERSTGWTFKTDPVFERIDRIQLAARLQAKLDGDAGRRFAAAGRAFQVLGVLPKSYDFISNLKKAYVQELLALYDLKEKKIFLVREALDQPPTPQDAQLQKAGKPSMRDITIAHEMVHALQHQHDPLFDLLEEDSPDLDDVSNALHSLAEGEATLHMLALLGPLQVDQIVRGISDEAASKLRDQPAILKTLMFAPYIDGTRFAGVRTAGKETGSAPRLHAASPLSTEHVLHPERTIEKDPPVAVFLPDLSAAVGGGRSLTYEAVLGERYLAPVLGTAIPAGPSNQPWAYYAGGWGGDRLQLYEKTGQPPAAVLLVRWDRAALAFVAYAQLADRAACRVAWNGRDVALVYGLGAADGDRVAREALGRLAAHPFKTPAELRSHRASARFPAAAAAGLGDLARSLDALAVEIPDPKDFDLAHGSVLRHSPRLASLAAARYNLGRPGQPPFQFGLSFEADAVEWTPEELDLLIRGGIRTDVNSKTNARICDALEKYGRTWPQEIVRAAVQWTHLQKNSQFADFLKKNATIPGVAPAALQALYMKQSEPAYRETFLKAIEDGLLTPMDTRGLGNDAGYRSRVAQAHVLARLHGRVEWNEQNRNILEGSFDQPDAIDLLPAVIEKWNQLPLTAKGRGHLLARSFKDPAGWKRSIDLARKELVRAEPGFWEAFSEGLRSTSDVKKLPHFKELLDALGALAQEAQAPPPLKSRVAALRR